MTFCWLHNFLEQKKDIFLFLNTVNPRKLKSGVDNIIKPREGETSHNPQLY